MSRFVEVLKKELKYISATIFSMLVFWLIFIMADLDRSYLYLGFQIILLTLAVYILVSYFMYKKELSSKEKLEEFELENTALKNKIIENKRYTQEYFLMWIHQIKTPITAANLLIDIDEIDKSAIKKQLFYIEDYTNMALTFLKISDPEADMDIAKVKLDEIIRPILKKYSIIFISNRITLEYEDIEDEVLTDSKWLSILIEQIISNAIKYSVGGKVSIMYHRGRNSLEIKDTGIGIRSEDIPKIFDRGYSGFNGRLNQKSSGIGLFLAKEISSKLSIKIDVKSVLSEGSSFFINFGRKDINIKL
ncbi:MAG: sensor histidine kinase [Peptostreptococcus sp.]|uniref:sensor histidine kinase n=1 Tax=Peptostreptococcus sp. TaxID=1262 RepID=UPI002FC8983A